MERYKQKLQPAQAKERTKWATVDFNSSPVSFLEPKGGFALPLSIPFRRRTPILISPLCLSSAESIRGK
jgi:hypothetical protein